MIRVYINPDYANTPPQMDNAGIRRVCEAMIEHLPKFGIQVVHNPDDAHIICNHGGSLVERPGIPSVCVNHGLYWSRQKWGDGYQQVNQEVIDTMLRAQEVTAPSEWVANAIRRGSLVYPTVVYHGVDADKFTPPETHGNYILWNKKRADAVSNPEDMFKVAQLLPGRQFVSTIGDGPENVHVVGTLPHDEMKKLVSEAGVYLSTVRETFGIGVLEAMAYGVPVAGFDCGGNSEIIIPGVTGYLAPWGDFKELANCIERCFNERETLSKNCIEDIKTRWRWEPRIEQYANIFKRVYARFYERENKPKVSVIVTAYKLDQFLPDCLQSIQAQSYRDFECIVVDDAQLQSTETIVRAFSEQDSRIHYVPTPHNLKLSGARNFGLAQSNGLYIRHMDADDMLAPNALELEVTALDQDSGIHIVYGHLETIHEDGTHYLNARGQVERGGWPPDEFNWFAQMAHLNQLPSTVMARREVYERSGGYRERMKRAEDAEFWCRVTSLGFRAKKITQAVTMFHRERADSKGATEWQTQGKEPDWTAWFPWRMGASEYGQGRDILRRLGNCNPVPHLVPFAAQGKSATMRMWYVHDYAYPVVSIIVTCGPGHKGYLIDALDSIQAQTFTDWECVIVNDTGEKWPEYLCGFPWAKVVNMDGNQGVSRARNEGYDHIRRDSRFVVYLDADDYWTPWFLERTVASAEANKGIVFSDMIKCEMADGREKMTIYHYPEFDCDRAVIGMQYPGSSVLYPRKAIQSVFNSQGGYDPDIPGMEDKDFQTAIHANGWCAYRVDEPLWVYRLYSTTKREKDYNIIADIKAYMDRKWSAYRLGEKKMGCGCGAKKIVKSVPSSAMTSSGNFSANPPQNVPEQLRETQMVQIEYVGRIAESFSVRSRIDPLVTYRFGNNDYHRTRAVFLADAEFLMGITNEFGQPNYRVVTAGLSVEERDPTAFLGVPIEVA